MRGLKIIDERLGSSSSLRIPLPRTRPIALVPCLYDLICHFSRSCRRLQAKPVDHFTPTNRIRNIALIRLVQVGVSQSKVSFSSINIILEHISAFLGDNRGTKVVDNKLGSSESSDDVFKFILVILWDDLVNPVIRLLKI